MEARYGYVYADTEVVEAMDGVSRERKISGGTGRS